MIQLSNGAQKDLLDAFISLCCELAELKDYRDNDLHKISPRVLGHANLNTTQIYVHLAKKGAKKAMQETSL